MPLHHPRPTDAPHRPLRPVVPAILSFALCAGLAVSGAGGAHAKPKDPTPVPAEGAAHSLRTAAGQDNYYFVMADRFADGNRANNTGGLGSDPLVSGYDPAKKGFYHGGDLKGLIGKLDYIQGLGTSAIWLTPSFKNKAVQLEDGPSAGYHGYWITDFTQIDPHLGTNDELKQLIDLAHRRGMKVYFDIITNHTADVIGYEEGARMPYRAKSSFPYLEENGAVFDDADHAGEVTFPAMDPASSFPYKPVYEAGEENLKVPAWLNDETLYHNRGNSTFAGESSTYGDFAGLDDLFTENPRVVDGMVEIYKNWIGDFGVDGFRIDTMKHVNDEFWQKFGPEVLDYAHAAGKEEFFMFGEVFDTSRELTSKYTTSNQMQAVLDFPFQAAAQEYASASGAATGLQALFQADDWYTDADSNVYQLPTFLGNHDMGRIGSFIVKDNPGASEQELVARDRLAHELMYFSRGNPVIYYGDEQGFTGPGGDQDSRQDMFASKTAEYLDDDLLGTAATHATSNYDKGHPLYSSIATLADVVEDHPALRTGAQQDRFAEETAGVYAFSRIDATKQREYVVAVNNTAAARTAQVPTYVAKRPFSKVYGGAEAPRRVKTDAQRNLAVTVPAFSAVVYEAAGRIPDSAAAPVPVLAAPVAAGADHGRVQLSAELPRDSFYEVTFQARVPGGEWQPIGTDDNYPYQVFHAPSTSGLEPGDAVEYRALSLDNARHSAASAVQAITVPEPVDPNGPGPVEQPGAVTIAGDLQSEAGCLADWQPDCAQTAAVYDEALGEWRLTLDLPAGTYKYKAAIDRAWAESYGEGGARDGADITLVHPGGRVTFTYSHATHLTHAVPASAQPGAVSVPGMFNAAMGCTADWLPDCSQAQLSYNASDGVWRGTWDLPAGSYGYKVAIDGSWAVNYGVGGVRDGGNLELTHDGGPVTISYNEATHLVGIS